MPKTKISKSNKKSTIQKKTVAKKQVVQRAKVSKKGKKQVADIVKNEVKVEIVKKEVKHIHFNDCGDGEGLVFMGCGGDLNDWVDFLSELIKDADSNFDVTTECEPFVQLRTTGGRIDLLLRFKHDGKIPIGALAMWRLRVRGCSWLSDYIVNYAEQHGF